MGWYYEIVAKDGKLLEASEAVYPTELISLV
jgi:hypothetical protein